MAHQPERMCAACRTRHKKSELLRVVLSQDEIVCDVRQKLLGRGVYVCKNAACAELLRKKKSLSRSFKRDVPETVYDAVAAICAGSDLPGDGECEEIG